MKRQSVILFLLLCAVLFVNLTPIVLSESEDSTIRVYVKGAVEQEQSIVLPMYSTINDVLGRITLSDDADTSSLNPYTILKDADVVTIPSTASSNNVISKISINSATVDELTVLKGIGPSLATRIIEYRESNGLFQTLDELMNVKGIGQSKFDNIKDSITL